MAIHEEEVAVVSGGFKKKIEASAMSMIMDNLQKTQYQFPVESTIRELTSNAIDATKEKFDALRILSGEVTAAELYADRDGELYNDSKFKPEYFDPKWLSQESFVTIEYVNRPDEPRDLLRIIDQGVGLGGERLRKFFNPGYSSKRLNKKQLGKFGLGSKSALSTGVRYYTVISNYNGRQYTFNAYDEHFEPIVPGIDLSTGKKNPYEDWEDGEDSQGQRNFVRVFYRGVSETPNGVTIEVEVKKVFKQRYLDAARNQLTYFDCIKCFDVNGSSRDEIKITSSIVYEDDIMILSDNKRFDKPHVVINNVNYGFVNFEELELTDKRGNIGIKLTAEEVEIAPNRESVIWSDKTRDSILNAFSKVQDKANDVLNEGIKHITCPLEWLIARHDLVGKTGQGSIMGRLSGIVDVDYTRMKFKGKGVIELGTIGEFSPVNPEKIFYNNKYEDGEYKQVKESQGYMQWVSFYKEMVAEHFQSNADASAGLPDVYIQKGNTSPVKDKYLFNVKGRPFFKIRLNTDADGKLLPISEMMAEVIKGLKKKTNFINYDEIEVPKNFVFADEAKEKETQRKKDEKEAERLAQAAINKEKVNIRMYSGTGYCNEQFVQPAHIFDEFNDDSIYYANSDVDPLVQLAGRILENVAKPLINKWSRPWRVGTYEFRKAYEKCYPHRGSEEERPVYEEMINQIRSDFAISMADKQLIYNSLPEKMRDLIPKTHILYTTRKGDAKKFKRYRPLEQFFHQYHPETGTMTVAMELQQVYTAELIRKSPAFYVMSIISRSGHSGLSAYPTIYKLYNQCVDLVGVSDNNISLNSSSAVRDAVVGHCDKLAELQSLVESGGTVDEISTLAKTLFSMPDDTASKVKNAKVYDSQIIETLRTLEDIFEIVPMLYNTQFSSTNTAGWDQFEQFLVDNNINL
jgi:hypothetical protein